MNATLTERLLLAEAARVEFERNIKAIFGSRAEVSIGIHGNSAAFDAAPIDWERKDYDGSRWATSVDRIGHISVFEAQA